MAMGYVPGLDDGEEDFGSVRDGFTAESSSSPVSADSQTPTEPEKEDLPSPEARIVEEPAKVSTATRISEPPSEKKHFMPDEEDDAEPLSPLSLFSSIAEPTHIKPVTGRRKFLPPSSSNRWSPQQQAPLDKPTEEKEEEPKTIDPGPRIVRVSPPKVTSSPVPPEVNSPAPSMPSRDEWRAKYAFFEEDDGEDVQKISRSDNAVNEERPPEQRRTPPPELSSTRQEDEIFDLRSQIERLEEEIFTIHGSKFNLKSYKQVSQALFGDPDQSTAKNVLEGMASSNILAKLLLEYRQASQKLIKLEKREANKDSRVKSIISSRPSSQSIPDSSSSDEASESPLLLLDTSSFIFRAYYSMPPLHRASDGLPCGAVLGFCNILNRLLLNSMLDGKRPHLVLCKDAAGHTFRNELYDQYKANRPEAPIDLIPQFDFIYQAAEAYGLVQIQAPGYEADDVIATLSQRASEQDIPVDILSGDKDLMQLITNSSVTTTGTVEMIDPMTMTRMTHDTVIEKWGVPAHQLGDVLALAGDQADNIPGVPGIGPKIAAQLIQEYNTLEELLENSGQIKQNKRRENLQNFASQARMSQSLVQLVTDIPRERLEVIPEEIGPFDIEDFRMEPMNADRILEFYDYMGFFTIKQRLLERLERQDRISYERAQHPQKQKSTLRTGTTRSKPFRKSENKVLPPKPEDFENVPF
jgi:DNA polymerase-1